MFTKFDLADMARRVRNVRRGTLKLREINPPLMFSTDLYIAVYKPTVVLWARAAEQVTVAYEATLSELITDSPVDFNLMLNLAADEFGRLFLSLQPALQTWANRLEKWQRDKWVASVLSGTAVDLTTLLGPEDMRQTVATAIEWNASLVKDVSAQARQRIANAVFEGIRNRTPARDVAKTIRESVGMARDRSLRIASDQMLKLSSALADQRRRQAGIEEWEWLHSRKLHPRADHVARNGKIYSDTNPPPTMPGQEPYCGCRQRALLRWD